MKETNTSFSSLSQALAELSRRLAEIERTQEALLTGQNRDRDFQRQSLALLAQLLERQMAALKQIGEKMSAVQQSSRRQAMVKGKVVIAKPTASEPSRPARSAPPPVSHLQNKAPAEASQPEILVADEPEIEQQISQALGNISALLKKKDPKRRKG